MKLCPRSLNTSRVLLVLAITSTVAILGCPPPKPPPSDADASPERYQAACANVAAYCPEGREPKCAEVLQHAVEARITKIDVDCLAREKSAEAIRKCGGVECKTDSDAGKDAAP